MGENVSSRRYPIWFWNEIDALETAARLVANGDTTAMPKLIRAIKELDRAREQDEADTRALRV